MGRSRPPHAAFNPGTTVALGRRTLSFLRPRFGAVLDTVDALDVTHLYSGHAPAVHGRVDTVLRHLRTVPDRPAWLPDADPVPTALAAHDLLSA